MKLIGYILLLITLIYWSYQLIFTSSHWIALDYANIIVHETGHMVLMLFPEFIAILGGSFFQVLVPCIALGYFTRTQQKMASIFSVFWIGNNLINVSVYIKDSQAMRLPTFLGIPGHDWNYLLTQLNLLKYDWIIGNFVFGLGIIILLASILWLILTTIQEFAKTN